MEQIGIATKEKTFKPENQTFEEEDIEDIFILLYDDTYKINYTFENGTNNENSQNLSFTLQISPMTNIFPFYSIIKITIISDSTKDKEAYEFTYHRTLLSFEDNNNYYPLRTNIPISQCYKWSFMTITVEILYFPYQKIPTGLNSAYSLCYLNSVVQMLYNIPKFRQIVFSYPINDTNQKPYPILLALQRLFSQMSVNSYKFNSDKNELPILNDFVPSALELAESFGWTHDDLVEEQDAYEFLTIFLDKLQALFLPFPDLSNQLDMLFNGQFMCNSKIEDFSSFSLPLSEDLKHSLNMCIHPNCKENYAKLYFAIERFIDFAKSKGSMPREYQILADELISTLNTNNKNCNCNNEYTKSSTNFTDTTTTTNNENNKLVSFDFNNNDCNELAYSVYRILKNDLNNSINQCCQELALALKNMAESDKNTLYPSKAAKVLSERLSSILQNAQPNNSSFGDIAQLICDFYLDEQVQKMSNATNYFVKLPEVFILQIRRFYDENGVAKKSNSAFQFPETLSMKDYLMPQNDDQNDNDDSLDYELQSVISHRGELNKGHYVEFSRPTSRDDFWFKFDEKNVTIVSKKEAINDNFGVNTNITRSFSLGSQKQAEISIPIKKINKANPQSLAISRSPTFTTPIKQTRQRESIIQPLNAYILVYVRKKSVKEIIDTEVKIPEKLAIPNVVETAPIVMPVSPKTNIIRMIKSDEVSKLIIENHFCMKDKIIFDNCTITIDRKKAKLETVLDLYNYVENEINGKFILWRCTNGFNPSDPLVQLDQKITEAITSYFDTFFLIQETGKENMIKREFSIFDHLFYLLFFDPFNPEQFKYLGLIEFNIDKSIESIFNIIKDKLNSEKIYKHKSNNKDENIEIAVFYENENHSAIYLSPDLSVKNIFTLKKSANLIVQFVYNIEDFNKELTFDNDYSLCNSFSHKDGESYTKLLVNASTAQNPFNPFFIDYYYKMKYDSIDVTFHRISTSDHITLQVPKKASMSELSRVLFNAFYEKERKRNNESALFKMQPISSHSHNVVQLIQNSNDKINIDNNNNNISQIIVTQQNVLAQLFYSCQEISYPATMPIQADPHSLFRSIVPQFEQNLNLFFEFFPPLVLSKNSFSRQSIMRRYVTVRVEISEDAIMSKKIYQVVIDNGSTTYADLSLMIGIDTNMLQNGDVTNFVNKTVYRVLMIFKGKIVKCINNYNERVREEDCKNYIMRFEKVPENQKGGVNTVIVRVHYGIHLNPYEVKLFGFPFYFAFNREESENTIYQRIKNEYMKFMKPDEKTEFVITNAQMKIMRDSGIESLTNNSSWCICILMNERIQLKEIIAMEKANSSKQLKIYT